MKIEYVFVNGPSADNLRNIVPCESMEDAVSAYKNNDTNLPYCVIEVYIGDFQYKLDMTTCKHTPKF